MKAFDLDKFPCSFSLNTLETLHCNTLKI